jgi:glutathione-regulated potassium-efflux system ancillary protein KefC
MMSTGLTFGTISALFGLNHQIITQAQYSFLVSAVIASAVLPTLAANTFFLPRHLLPRKTQTGDGHLPVQSPIPRGEEA